MESKKQSKKVTDFITQHTYATLPSYMPPAILCIYHMRTVVSNTTLNSHTQLPMFSASDVRQNLSLFSYLIFSVPNVTLSMDTVHLSLSIYCQYSNVLFPLHIDSADIPTLWCQSKTLPESISNSIVEIYIKLLINH